MTPSPTERSPYLSVGRDPCVPPQNAHFAVGHAGPSLQKLSRFYNNL